MAKRRWRRQFAAFYSTSFSRKPPIARRIGGARSAALGALERLWGVQGHFDPGAGFGALVVGGWTELVLKLGEVGIGPGGLRSAPQLCSRGEAVELRAGRSGVVRAAKAGSRVSVPPPCRQAWPLAEHQCPSLPRA